VLLSTLSVYGIGPFEDVEEDAPLRPVSAYAVSKAECEVALQAQEAITSRVVLRPGLVFGEGDRGNLLSMTRLIDRGLYFHIAGNAARKSVVCAADVARIVECCLRLHPEGDHVFNVANAAPVGVVELADLIAEQLGRRKSASLPRAIVRLGALVMDAMLGSGSPLSRATVHTLTTTTTCSIRRLVSRTGCQPSLELSQALAEEIGWARAAGLLRPVV
jgi:nucleoside-diphosphate-sugar epimerase